MLEVRESEILGIAEQYVPYKLDGNNGLFWLFDVKEGTCFNLNETSFFIISCFDGKTSTSEIFQRLLLRYPNEDQKIITNDFKELIESLKKQKVLCIYKANQVR